MADQNTTLRHLLSQQKPYIPCTSTTKRNTSYRNWTELGSVTIWREFNLTNLNESYSHVLDSPLPAREDWLWVNSDLEGVVIQQTADIDHMIGWNDRLMVQTVQFAQWQLGLHPGTSIRHQYSAVDKSVLARLPGQTGKKLSVDHVISLDCVPWLNLVVGLGRESSRWSGRSLAGQLDDPNRELLWPLRQLANICEHAQTRYGYIQPDEELVVCCFSKNCQGLKAEIMPIPWTKSGDEDLTTDLGLWWLCMLAMSAQSRSIADEREVLKINAWVRLYLDEERGWVRRHQYSRVEEPTSPPPPPEYMTPSPGNPAAFAAAVGLDTNDWFNIDATEENLMADFVCFNPQLD
ncbi:hypothetical protein NQ176_g4538 [Zarea fungicola]|uniref:Uncharacterized protein n=1 Tax=Zarea fungicola TaxID=93591 RepID=A0ACC1NE10_9HYPO|nr:hypothetical protein NQ176_g4538 [Lecanicillium fungicola]